MRKLVVRVEQYRDLFIELRQHMDDPVQHFTLPALEKTNNIEKTVDTAVDTTRKWICIKEPLDFEKLKELLEEKGVFVFLTGKYKGWSYIEQAFRGLTITHSTTPVIIINNSDSKKAQSFTLMHELGHLIRGDTSIDGKSTTDADIEKWCDLFSGKMLMPAHSEFWQRLVSNDLADIKRLAQQFKVSPYACLVRLRQLQKIDQQTYSELEAKLDDEYKKLKEKQKNRSGGAQRDRVKEVRTQFGTPFINTVLTAWHSQEITLHKATKLLDLKRPQQFLDLGVS